MGVVSPLGCDVERFWERIRSGQSGIRRIDKFDAPATKARSRARSRNSRSTGSSRRRNSAAWTSTAATPWCGGDGHGGFGLDMNAEVSTGRRDRRFGVGGLQTLEEQHTILMEKGPSRCSPFMIPEMIVNMAGGLIAIKYG